ncbi:MAG: DUF3102 domain-containing protein [Methylacidiphilales bacterium]|nr:DUF3102 domain-containing protein [Candidatus Methylacidiphilales bacterium]NJR16421.1 DUF3102 domain-containing protein [Calothrix sp. CSU_2_0]
MVKSSRKDTKDKIVTHFDYEVLTPEQRSQLQQWTMEIREQLRRTAQDIWEIGQRLAEVRAQLKHGQFDAWLKAEFGWSRRTAYNFINVYETFGNRANLAQIDIATSALYLLAAPSTPEKFREQYIDEAKTGKRITHKDLAQKIKQQQEKVDSQSEPAKQPEILAILPQKTEHQNSGVIDVTPTATTKIQPTNIHTNINTNITNINIVSESQWWNLGTQHLLFCGDTASSDFFANIPHITLAIAVTADDWDHDWLIEEATNVIVLQHSSLKPNTIEQLILMFSQPGELVVFPWIPQDDVIAIAHNLQRNAIAGDSSIEKCQRAILASGLMAHSL